ncbi:MAG: BamA/TamA family outer membrane protein [Candidatus Amulumruptor caecigallinarius]|nr:BamA/TamA family outer membrane protein [Candidatus Amulumruptor caecigallinarius]
MLCACSSTRFVPDGKYLLDDIDLKINDSTKTMSSTEMFTYIHQRPNNRFLHMSRLRLGVYNLSGTDSTKWWNKWVRKLGEPPVIYDAKAARTDSLQLLKAMNNAGFLDAEVRLDSFPNHRDKKIKLKYIVDAGSPHYIDSITYEFPNDTLRTLIMRDSAIFPVKRGERLDRSILDAQRDLIVGRMQNRGYWAFSKEFITFNADTTIDSDAVDLTMTVHPPYESDGNSRTFDTHATYMVRNVYYITHYDAMLSPAEALKGDTIRYKGIYIINHGNDYLRPSVLYENCFIRPEEPFSRRSVDRTYNALGRLPILKFIQIRMVPAGKIAGINMLDAYIMLTPARSQFVSFEVEGTNSEGDLGVALGINYTHRNIGHGSETLNLKLRGSYEAVNGNLDGFIHDRFMEYSLETSLTFPKFKAPFLKESFKRRVNANTELHFMLNYQERPEYTRIISTAGWSYKWSRRNNRHQYTFTPIDVNYVYLPQSTNDFINQIAPDNPLLRYSYEDHFIMRTGFNFYYTNKRRTSPWYASPQRDVISLRAAVETAGNLLFAISEISHHGRNFHEDPYSVFGINYSQYVRGDIDFSYLHTFSRRTSLACYAGFGIGVPYGNSSILPFEKRFYGGGANGVRGWDVRTLGPGRFPGTNSVSDFIYQCGDIRLNLSAEFRAKLFWIVEGGLFVDMGNIWTIRDYPSQPYGEFQFNSFYKELAAAYGAGLRLDFTYFLVRLDLGMKAHNPAIGADPWPLMHPRWHRDSSLHFSIGYPF